MATKSDGGCRGRLDVPASAQGSAAEPGCAQTQAGEREQPALEAQPGERGEAAIEGQPGERGEAVLERLTSLPGGPQVLQLAAQHEDVAVVGGAVRDLLLGVQPREIDLVIDGSHATFQDAAALFARELARLLSADSDREDDRPQVSIHERFGTAVVCWGDGRVDVAARRSERYPQPGALPEVGPAGEQQDLMRRDFTVNAIAVGLCGSRRGVVSCAPNAIEDLHEGRLRVLHARSFEDDPTRLMRLARYCARLRFTVEPCTARLASQALEHGALSELSGARIGAELRLALSEPDPIASLQTLQQLGVLRALQPPMALEPALLEMALRLLPDDGRPDLLALGCLLLEAATSQPAQVDEDEEPPDARDELLQALERWEQPASDRRPVIETAMYAYLLGEEMGSADSPSELWELLCGVAVEAIALAGAVAQRDGDTVAHVAAQSWLQKLRHVKLQISGDDLLAAGVPAGPEIGERLAEALRLRLDEMIDEGAEAELRAALRR
jgi:tRNA nucleotidyltransferase (CCA-adding enzyme)